MRKNLEETFELDYSEKALLLGRANNVANTDLAELPPETLEIYIKYFESALKLVEKGGASARAGKTSLVEANLEKAVRRALCRLHHELKLRQKGLYFKNNA